MTDIVERLQALGRCEHDDFSLGFEAADEIERLRHRVAELEEINKTLVDKANSYIIESGKLANELATLKAGHSEPVAWMGYGPRNHWVEFCTEKPAPSVMRDFKMQPLYTSAPTIPEGWQLVPVEPTSEMVKAGNDGFKSHDSRMHTVASCYQSMLAAAPKP